MEQTGKRLSMHGDAIYKGDVSHNGTMLKIHENAYTIGYSKLANPAGTGAGTVKFGDGVFLNAKLKNNQAFAGKPTTTGAVPVFGGIVVREPAIASGYPAMNDEINAFQQGLLCREGFIVYKKAYMTGHTTERVGLFDNDVTYGFNLFVKDADGTAFFSSSATETGYTLVGKVVEVNPDDKSVTVKVSA